MQAIILENVEHCGGEPEQGDKEQYYITDIISTQAISYMHISSPYNGGFKSTKTQL